MTILSGEVPVVLKRGDTTMKDELNSISVSDLSVSELVTEHDLRGHEMVSAGFWR